MENTQKQWMDKRNWDKWLKLYVRYGMEWYGIGLFLQPLLTNILHERLLMPLIIFLSH